MERAYIPILMIFAVSALQAVGMVALSHWLSTHRPTPVKLMPYESGITPLGDARGRLTVKFYLVAMLFIVFDIETVFLYPWAMFFRSSLDTLGLFLMVEMGVFVVILGIGLVYVWKKGALEWD
ncbi:MAG: NADH-quinone oxidoreductase subunit A [Gemmatimonadota bacterium]